MPRSTGDPVATTGWCYTEWYDSDDSYVGEQYYCDNCSDSNHTIQYMRGSSTVTMDWYYGPRCKLVSTGIVSKVRVSIPESMLTTAYAYNETTGQIYFAGKDSIYYGYRNINDMPT